MKSVLIIGPDSANRLTFLRVLGRRGWWVDIADSVEGALGFLDQPPRRVVLIDWHIADGSGLALLQAIKSNAVWQSVPVVMMYDQVTATDIERAFALGANDFLCSPFTSEAALRKIGRWVLDQPGTTEALQASM